MIAFLSVKCTGRYHKMIIQWNTLIMIIVLIENCSLLHTLLSLAFCYSHKGTTPLGAHRHCDELCWECKLILIYTYAFTKLHCFQSELDTNQSQLSGVSFSLKFQITLWLCSAWNVTLGPKQYWCARRTFQLIRESVGATSGSEPSCLHNFQHFSGFLSILFALL